MEKKIFMKTQIGFWIAAAFIVGLSAETQVKDLKSFAFYVFVVIICGVMALLNYRLYELEK